jgi:hypothetical protein
VSAALAISLVSVTLALASFVVNLVVGHRAAVRARKPVLVFVDDPEAECWVLRNVGNGPALNVVVAQRAAPRWFNPVRVPPLGRETSFPLTWLGRVNVSGLGATYGDFEGRRYTSTLGAEVSRAYEGERLPRWREQEIRRYWELGAGMGSPTVTGWGERSSDFGT